MICINSINGNRVYNVRIQGEIIIYLMRVEFYQAQVQITGLFYKKKNLFYLHLYPE